jgi:hypothetical protein
MLATLQHKSRLALITSSPFFFLSCPDLLNPLDQTDHPPFPHPPLDLDPEPFRVLAGRCQLARRQGASQVVGRFESEDTVEKGQAGERRGVDPRGCGSLGSRLGRGVV